jgi:HlyD family secretion protein
MTQIHVSPNRKAIRRYLIAAAVGCLMLVGGIGGWAATTTFSGAVIAIGSLVVESNVKKVQHPSGGIVGQLFVREGDRVQAGDLLLHLDETVTRANLLIVTDSLDEQTARKARLEAERDDASQVEFGALADRNGERKIARLLAGEEKLFEFRRQTAASQKSQLKERIQQFREEIEGLKSQTEAKAQEIVFIQEELKGVMALWDKNLIQITRLMTLKRDATRLEGERGSLVASLAQTKGKISEIELQILLIDQQLKSEVSKDLGEVRAKSTELEERKVAAEDQLRHVDIRAPQNGIVHQLAAHTVGGVIAQGEPIMLIVPVADSLQVEGRISPNEIDQVQLGARATLRFTSFNQRTTPQIDGEVTRISADTTQDPKTGQPYYTVRIAFTVADAKRLGEVKLVPGMPVEAFIQTHERTVLSYLVKPMEDQLTRAFREK